MSLLCWLPRLSVRFTPGMTKCIVHMIFSDVTLLCMRNVLSVHLQPSAVNDLIHYSLILSNPYFIHLHVCTCMLCVYDTENGKYVGQKSQILLDRPIKIKSVF